MRLVVEQVGAAISTYDEWDAVLVSIVIGSIGRFL